LSTLNPNKAYGPDGISPRILKEARPAITKVLTRIFNLSITKGIFPALWKRANVLPIFKKAEQFLTSNYRPISLLPTLAKVFEKIVFKYLFNFFRTNFMISIWQSGFLPGTSTVTQLIEIYDQFCKAVAKGKDVRVVFLDISKAFDTVWHKGLIYKLKAQGIRGKILAWLIDYLHDRQQRVVINGIHSQWGSIEAGVPQGSVLGPLLFLIFINDLTFVVNYCKIRLFADDTCLFIEVDNPDLSADCINQDLQSIDEWSKKWLVNFSPPKTEEMIITNKRPRQHPPLYLNDQLIKNVKDHKHLGIHLSSNLSWRKHVQEIAKKANRSLGVLRMLKMKLDRKSLETLYKSFVRPILEYGDAIWHIPNPVNLTMLLLDKVHVNAARIVTGATARCHIEELFQEIGWETLFSRREFHRANIMFNIVQGTAPTYLQDLLPDSIHQRTTYNLRNRGDLDQPYTRTVTYANSFIPSATKQWNDLPVKIKQSQSDKSFKHNYLAYFPRPTQSKLFNHGNRFPSVHHARMRIRCSKLNKQLHDDLHVIDNPNCECILNQPESPEHYFMHCPWYTLARQTLFAELEQINVRDIDSDLLLYGSSDFNFPTNISIIDAVHKYIVSTKRFD
jgi:hypothetical protein